MPNPAKPLRCPTCRKRMSRAGETVGGAPVWHCPYCLTVKTRGALKVPQTPVWRGEPGRDPRSRRDRPL